MNEQIRNFNDYTFTNCQLNLIINKKCIKIQDARGNIILFYQFQRN